MYVMIRVLGNDAPPTNYKPLTSYQFMLIFKKMYVMIRVLGNDAPLQISS